MSLYVKTALCVEEWHCLFLSYVKTFLYEKGVYDLTPQQMLLIYHIKEDTMRISEIAYGSFFWGTNPHYNLTKLIRTGYLSRHRNPKDQRLSLIALDEKGKQLRQQFNEFLQGEFFQREGKRNRVFSQNFIESLCALFDPS